MIFLKSNLTKLDIPIFYQFLSCMLVWNEGIKQASKNVVYNSACACTKEDLYSPGTVCWIYFTIFLSLKPKLIYVTKHVKYMYIHVQLWMHCPQYWDNGTMTALQNLIVMYLYCLANFCSMEKIMNVIIYNTSEEVRVTTRSNKTKLNPWL